MRLYSSPGQQSTQAWVLSVIVLAILLRVVLIHLYPVIPVSDARTYFESAQGLARGEGFTLWGARSAFFPPGFPFFLAMVFSITGVSVVAAQIANSVLSAAAALVIARIATEITASGRIGLFTAILVAFYPEQIAYSLLLATEPLALLLLALGIHALILHRRLGRSILLVLAGIVFGLASLTRAEILPLAPILVLVLGGRRSGRGMFNKQGCIVLISLVLTVLPWTVRNHRAFGRVIPVAGNAPINLYIGNNPHATGTYTEEGFHLIGEGDPGCLAVGHALKNSLRTVSLWPRKIYYLLADPHGTGLTWLWRSRVPHSLGAAEHEAILDFAKAAGRGRTVRVVYALDPDTDSYRLQHAPEQALIEVDDLILQSGVEVDRHPPRMVRLAFKSILLLWYGALIVLGARGAGVAPLLHLVIAAYYILVAMVFFGTFRFNYVLVPWFAIPLAVRLNGLFREKSSCLRSRR